MTTLQAYRPVLFTIMIVFYLTHPAEVEGGMKKGGMGGGGGGVVELLAAGIVAKLLQEMGGLGRLTMGKGMQQQMTKYVPVPIFVASGGHMMMNNGWKGGMMMNSGWKGGMMMGGD